ncbi:hypothetical protein FHT77_005964 [Rhizobium sp. BK181]|nr:hypothetical protein [Rhizobium sp. BK181]
MSEVSLRREKRSPALGPGSRARFVVSVLTERVVLSGLRLSNTILGL